MHREAFKSAVAESLPALRVTFWPILVKWMMGMSPVQFFEYEEETLLQILLLTHVEK